jgi:hypothetical protein
VHVLSSSHNLLWSFSVCLPTPGRLYKCYLQVKWRRKGSLINSLRMFSLLSKKLISLLFDGTLKQRTHLYCAKWNLLRTLHCCRSERALSERARQQTKIVQLLKISMLLEPQSMLVESHFTNMQRAAIWTNSIRARVLFFSRVQSGQTKFSNSTSVPHAYGLLRN